MAENSKIEWTDHTFNPWTGCTKVSPACDHCYAEGWAKRSGHVQWGPHAPRRKTTPATWGKPLIWDRQARQEGIRKKVFCASLADVFDNHRSIEDAWRQELWQVIKQTPNLDWLLLTKRPQNATRYVPETWLYMFPSNVWVGTTVENQVETDRRLPDLLSINAAKRFLSVEPMLEQIDLTPWLWGRPDPCEGCPKDADCECGGELRSNLPGLNAIDWVICGGESGPGARGMHPDWPVSIASQCKDAAVPFFFKQWGEYLHESIWNPFSGHPNIHEFNGEKYIKVGKKKAGRYLHPWGEISEVPA